MVYLIGKCGFNGTRPFHETIRGGIEVLHNGAVKNTQTRGAVNVWSGTLVKAVIYSRSNEVGKHIFKVSGSLQ